MNNELSFSFDSETEKNKFMSFFETIDDIEKGFKKWLENNPQKITDYDTVRNLLYDYIISGYNFKTENKFVKKAPDYIMYDNKFEICSDTLSDNLKKIISEVKKGL